jgi:hypothetical protein
MNRIRLMTLTGLSAIGMGISAYQFSRSAHSSIIPIQHGWVPAQRLDLDIPNLSLHPGDDPSLQALIISTCNGINAHANIRAYPSFDPSAIIGYVEHNNTVWLTGNSIRSDGIRWHEVYVSSLKSEMDDVIPPHHLAWIADCFLVP